MKKIEYFTKRVKTVVAEINIDYDVYANTKINIHNSDEDESSVEERNDMIVCEPNDKIGIAIINDVNSLLFNIKGASNMTDIQKDSEHISAYYYCSYDPDKVFITIDCDEKDNYNIIVRIYSVTHEVVRQESETININI